MPDEGRVQSPERVVEESLRLNMPLRMSPLGLAQEALRALDDEGYVVMTQDELAEKVEAPLRRLQGLADRLMGEPDG